jgi:hypothetical protein
MVHDSRWCGEKAAVYDTPTLAPAGDGFTPCGESTPIWGLSGVIGVFSQVADGRFWVKSGSLSIDSLASRIIEQAFPGHVFAAKADVIQSPPRGERAWIPWI